ncbi:hypothetical protein JVT61DRAFT_7686 [Boletus reticuloceps]|uniref:Uncharacterized protein n=1 Tax=Boletus reticuloceps TaxID=495285 RepID=A0A8I3A719_9AGAM|nr:hypothetical protein JVT61DRAFT_7686 [Boletus reticuloceps]
MPKSTSYHWSFHRHFSPLVCQTAFPPERTITPPPLTQHKLFAREDLAVQSQLVEAPIPQQGSTPHIKVLIPKPRGEVSRINRGGYNLQEKLGWPATDYEEIRGFVIQLAREYLNTTRPWGRQFPDQLQIVFRKVKERFPLLCDYEGDWVVSDFLRVYLKNSSAGRAS